MASRENNYIMSMLIRTYEMYFGRVPQFTSLFSLQVPKAIDLSLLSTALWRSKVKDFLFYYCINIIHEYNNNNIIILFDKQNAFSSF